MNRILKPAFISLCLLIAIAVPLNVVAQHGGGYGGGHGGHEPEPEPPPPPPPPTDDEVKWRTDDVNKAFEISGKEKKLVFMYFYFTDKDDFPVKYDRKIREYGDAKVIFAKFFVRMDDKGEMTNISINTIYEKNKLPKKSIGLIFDQFGNLIDKVPLPVNAKILTGSFDRAEKKVKDVEKSLSKQWDKVEEYQKKENRPDAIREMNKIIKTNWQGYEVFLNAQKELGFINAKFIDKYNEIISEYLKKDEKERDKDAIITQLKSLLKESGDLSVETIIKETIDKIQNGIFSKEEENKQEKIEEKDRENEKEKTPKKDGEEPDN